MTSPSASGLEDAVDQLHIDPSKLVPVRKNHRARNITEQFNQASAALETGQLVKDEAFSLFDSVQALEIMDPKMDTGFLNPGETLEETYDVCRDLSPGEVIWIMDELLCYEMAWHQGYPLAQNLLTSVYIYNLLVQERLPNSVPYFRPLDGSQREPGPMVQKVLRAFCIGIIKSCDIVIEMIQMQQYYEEEDLNTHTFGLDLLTDIPDDEIFRLNKEAIKWITEQDDSKSMETSMCASLASRLTCRQHFLYLVLPQAEQAGGAIDSATFRKLTIGITKPLYEKLRKPVNESFSSKFQRKLASTVPPRPIVKLPLEEAVQFLSKMYEDIKEAILVEYFGCHTTIATLSQFLWAYASREPAPFARAVLQMLLFNEGKFAGPGDGIKGLLITDLRHLLVDPACLQESFWDIEVPQDPRHQVARAVDVFMEQAPQEFINVLRSICQNRCRIRRCLINVVKDVDTLVTDLLDIFGGDPSTQSASSFPALVKHALILLTLRLEADATEWAIQLGFELDIYQPFELPCLQTYVTSVAKTRRLNLENFMNCMSSCKHEVMRVSGIEQLLCRVPNEAYTHREEDIWEGLTMLYVALAHVHAITVPTAAYTSSQALIDLRMKPFMALTYFNSLTAADLGPSYMSTMTLADLLAQGSTYLDAARKRIAAGRKEILDTVPKEHNLMYGVTKATTEQLLKTTTDMLKAAVKGSVAIEALKRALKEAGGDESRLRGRVRISFEQPRVGSYWVAPRVEVAKS